MTVEGLCTRVTQLGFTLLGAELALDARQHRIEVLSRAQKSLTWVRDLGVSLITGSQIADYLSLLQRQEYSYLMNDGGAVQIAYVFRDSEIERHRLAYYPCPFPIEKDELQAFGGGLVDFISEVLLTRMEETLQLCSPVRFDYAPEAIGDFHPASHVTINTSTCRIPARSPLQFDNHPP
jgi:hypothetical protein